MTKPKRRNRSNARNRTQMQDSGKKNAQAELWLWGAHAVQAALTNPKRHIKRIVASENAARKLTLFEAERLNGQEIARLLPPGAVHQGLAVLTAPLPVIGLTELIERRPRRIAVLDQISDPHNLGAVMRSAVAFGVEAMVLQTRHSPPVTGIVAKSAAGAAETLLECRVVNIARALDELAKAGVTSIGLAGQAETALADLVPEAGPVALVFGAEGAGLRPAVAKACTWLAKIPMSAQMESLNISNAAAIAFYELAGKQTD